MSMRSDLLGQLISARMAALGLNQSQLAKLVGTSSTSTHKWIRGGTRPQYEIIPRIASALRLPLDEVYAAAGYKEPDPAALLGELDAYIAEGEVMLGRMKELRWTVLEQLG